MGDLQTLHKTARSLILSLREGLEHLEKSEQVNALFRRSAPCVPNVYALLAQGPLSNLRAMMGRCLPSTRRQQGRPSTCAASSQTCSE